MTNLNQLILGMYCNNSFIVNAANKALYTIDIVRGNSCSYRECSNNDIVTLIFIALDQLGES